MGTLISALKPNGQEGLTESELLVRGMTITMVGTSLMLLIGIVVKQLGQRYLFGALLEVVLFKWMFSLKGLSQAASSVHKALIRDDLTEARRLTAWHLVSRDTSQLDKSQIAAAAIESVAENTSDGVIAPIFYYLVLGLPGALIYRFANTADSMLGYRHDQYEWLGKIPARLDDLLNLVPARLTALLITITSTITQDNTQGALATWRRDRSLTASPNAGQPMSAMAGALDVSLTKVDYYTLGEGNRQPRPKDIQRSIYLMRTAVLLFVGLISCLLWLQQKWHNR